MTSWAMGWGNAVAHIHRPQWPFGGAVELTPLLPDRTIPVRITERMVKNYDIDENLLGVLYYQTRINDVEVSFPATDCLHIRGLGPSTYWGWDIVELLVQHIGGSQARAEFGHRFYGQGANPGGFIEVPGGLDEEAELRFTESIKRGMEGMGKAHRIMVLEEGAKFNQWTIDPEKAQFIEGLEFDYRVIANIIGIKVHKLIDSANSSYNSLEQANSEHRDDDLLPWINQWTGEYNKKMLTDLQRNRMTHVIDIDDEYIEGFVPFRDRVAGVVEAKNNDLITRDEGRSRLNWGPSRDSNGKRFTIPMNIEFTDDKMSIADMAKLKSPAPPRNLPSPADDRDDDTDDEDDSSAATRSVRASDTDATSTGPQASPSGLQDSDEIVIEAESTYQYDCRTGDHGNVYLDGELVKYAVACDPSRGVVLCQVRNEDGTFELKDGAVPFVEKTGTVHYIPRELVDQLTAEDKAAAILAQNAFNTAKDAWLDKIKARVGKQASKIAAKPDKSEFLHWVDSMDTESAPGELQAHVDQLYRSIKTKFLSIVETASDSTLSEAVAEEVNSWSLQK
jgi:HK97 family phage portal protein